MTYGKAIYPLRVVSLQMIMSEQNNNSSEEFTKEQTAQDQSLEKTREEQTNANKAELSKLHDLLKQLPEELLATVLAEKIQQDRSASGEIIKVVKAVSQEFSGPIPPPQVLAGYDNVQAGFANRIVAMAEKEQAHRHFIEDKALSSSISIQKRGQIFALILSLLILIGSMFLIYNGREISGSVLAGSVLIGLAYTFINGRKRDEPKDEKALDKH